MSPEMLRKQPPGRRQAEQGQGDEPQQGQGQRGYDGRQVDVWACGVLVRAA